MKLNNKSECPPGGWRFRDPDTGRLIVGGDWNHLISNLKAHRKANKLEVWEDILTRVENWLCENIPKSCGSDAPVRYYGRLDVYTQVEQVTMTLASWVKSGFKRPPIEEIERRASICATSGPNGGPCPMNQGINCTTCVKTNLMNKLFLVFGNLQFQHRGSLQGCNVCGCSLFAKVQIPLDILQKHTPTEQFTPNHDLDLHGGFPDFCWMRDGKPDLTSSTTPEHTLSQ